MALSKDIELNNGVIAKYHNIASIARSKDISRGNETSVTLHSYISAEAREAGKDFIAQQNYLIPEKFSFADIYAELKNLEAFSGALDC